MCVCVYNFVVQRDDCHGCAFCIFLNCTLYCMQVVHFGDKVILEEPIERYT